MKKKLKVLVVDDSHITLRAFERTFRASFDITCVRSGVDALSLLERQRFDVALVDYVMPGMSGVELIEAIGSLGDGPPCIIVTAFDELDEVITAQRSGLVPVVIRKPWKQEEVERWVEHVARLSAMNKAVEELKSWSSGCWPIITDEAHVASPVAKRRK